MSKWEDISDILNPNGLEKLKVGQVMLFQFEGSPIHLKVMRKAYGKVWVKRTHLYTEEELGKLKVTRKDDAVRPKKDNHRK